LIRYITYSEIDKVRWDACIDKASNGIIFAYSWYLDNVCEEWDALIAENYDAVMPLPKRKKLGIEYIFTPFFLNQLGVLSKKPVTAEIVDEFLTSIPAKFRYVDLSLHSSNSVSTNDFKIEKRTIQQLDLNKSYPEIEKDYSENLKRNLKKADKNELRFVKNINPEVIVDVFRNAQGEKLDVFKKKDYEHLLLLMQTLIRRGMGEMIGVYSKENTMLAAACFMQSHDRIIYLKGAANEEGKTLGAMHFLMASYIREKASKKLIFDFGGSSVESVARFNTSFGTKEAVYLHIQRNNLPKFVRWMKE